MKRPLERPLWLWMIPILLLLVWLGTLYGNAEPLWVDERNTIDSTGGVFTPDFYTLPHVWQDVAENHPEQVPAYQTLANLWMRVVGTEPAAIRVLSLFIGCLGAVVVYRLGRYAASSERVGLVAALLWATSMLIAYYLIRVRTYSLVAALSGLTLLLYLRAVDPRREPSRWVWVGLSLSVTALLYSHYLVALLLVGIGVNHLLLLRQARGTGMRRWWRVSFALAAGVLLFLPWLPNLVNGLHVEGGYEDRGLSLIDSFGVLAEFFGNGLPLLAVAALVAVALTRTPRGRLRAVTLIAVVTTALLMIYFQISDRLRVTRPSYMITLWPLLDLLAAAAIVRLQQAGRLRALLATALLVAFAAAGIRAVIIRDAHETIEHLHYLFPIHVVDLLMKQNGVIGDRVVVALPDALTAEEDELSRIAAEDSRIDLDRLSYRTIWDTTPEHYAAATDELNEEPRLWLAYAPDRTTSARDAFAEVLAEQQFAQCPRSLALSQARIDQYAQTPVCCLDENLTPLARFGDGIRLLKIGLPEAPTRGQTPITLLWSVAPDIGAEQYSVSLQLWDAAGQKVVQHDYGFDLISYPCDRLTLDTSTLDAATYTVMITVYDWRTGQRLPGMLDGTAPTTDLLPVGSLTLP